ncbi:hypothetical protein SLE2022_011730 [Rubroshorea leprosula]
MPAQKRSYEASATPDEEEDEPTPFNNNHDQRQQENDDDDDDADESDRSGHSSSNEEKEEFVLVKLSDIRKEVQCPICLGIIRKTRTVMECLHRFCRECIDKSMRMGNNECPACRTHCASRRSLRDDPNYDALIAALYPDIDKFEEEELALHEEEMTRNKQIQDSIAQTLKRQSEALGRKRTAKTTPTAIPRRTQNRYRGRRNYRNSELQISDDEAANGDGSKDSSSADEHSTESKTKRYKRWSGDRFSHPSSAASADGGIDGNESCEANRESICISAMLLSPSERLAWGKGGIRSHTRHGSTSCGNGRNARNSRILKLVDHLRNLDANNDELDIQLMMVPVGEERIPSLQKPYLCCKPTLSVMQLCQYVALHTALQADEIEMHLVKELNSTLNSSASMVTKPTTVDPCRDKLQVLNQEETLGALETHNLSHGHLLLAYRRKS